MLTVPFTVCAEPDADQSQDGDSDMPASQTTQTVTQTLCKCVNPTSACFGESYPGWVVTRQVGRTVGVMRVKTCPTCGVEGRGMEL